MSGETEQCFARAESAPMAPGATEDSGFCGQPGHGNFEAKMYCKSCGVRYCNKCTHLHLGHSSEDASGFNRVVSAPSTDPRQSTERNGFNDQMAQFRRTTSASSQAAERAIALANGLRRRLSTSIVSSDKTISSAKSTLKEAGEAILKWFAGLSGQALDAAISKAFQQFDLDGTGLLDRDEFAKAMHAMGLRLTPEELKELFDSFDTDGNGTIDTKEFAQMVKKRLGKTDAAASYSVHATVHSSAVQNWHSDESMHSPSATVLQKWVRAALGREHHIGIHRSAICIQKGVRGMHDRKHVKRLCIQSDKDGRYTELNLSVEELLASIPLLCKVPTHLRHLLAKSVVYRSFAPDDLIVLEGEPADSMLILINGNAKVVRGRERKEVMRLKAGNFFGENSLCQAGETRHASVIAKEEVTCLEIRRDVYQQCLGGDGHLTYSSPPGEAFLHSEGQEGHFSRAGSAAEIVAASMEAASQVPEVPAVPGYLRAQNRQQSAGRQPAAGASSRREISGKYQQQKETDEMEERWDFRQAGSNGLNHLAFADKGPATSAATFLPRTRSADDSHFAPLATHEVRPLDLRSLAPLPTHARANFDTIQPLAPTNHFGLRSISSKRLDFPWMPTTLPRRQPSTSREQAFAPKSARNGFSEFEPAATRSNVTRSHVACHPEVFKRASSSPGDGFHPPKYDCLGPCADGRLPRVPQSAREDSDTKARSCREPWGRASDATRVNGWMRDDRGQENLWTMANAMLDEYQSDVDTAAASKSGRGRSLDKVNASGRHGSSAYAQAALRTTPRGSTSSRAKLFFGSTKASSEGPASAQPDFRRTTSVPGRRPKGLRKAFVVEQVDLRS